MLTELRIENFAIIQNLELRFSAGLTTLTGETGAGKSIILDAILALIGGPADAGSIRSGADRAVVEAVFTLPGSETGALRELLQTEDLWEDGGELTLSRELRREGRSTARVNGRSASLSLLREVGSFLVDIHGQSEHLSLLNVRQHLGLLDRYADSEAELSAYKVIYLQLTGVRKELNSLRIAEQDANRRTDLLAFQAQEIEAARLLPGEEEELRQERSRLANAESLATLAQNALNLLDESNPETPAITDLAGQVVQALHALNRIDSSLESMAGQAETAADLIGELTRDLRAYLEKIEFNPRRLEQVEERIETLSVLKRKYGGTLEAVLAYAVDARAQLETIAHASERITELEAQESLLLQDLAIHAETISALRKQAADLLAKAVEQELDDLSMAGAQFAVNMGQSENPEGLPLADGRKLAFTETGVDQVEFLIAPNPGEGLKPLVKTASGGETSRLMLALKNVLARADAIPTLIFDEIDQGIGGRVGAVVGEKLWQLGRRHQVFCVTHLPQLAAFGNQQLRVYKQVTDGRTNTGVDDLDENKRIDELALMLGGITEANRIAAQETLAVARLRIAMLLKV